MPRTITIEVAVPDELAEGFLASTELSRARAIFRSIAAEYRDRVAAEKRVEESIRREAAAAEKAQEEQAEAVEAAAEKPEEWGDA